MKSSARMKNNKQIHIFWMLMKKMCVRLTSSLCVEKPIWDISMWNELWLEPSVPAGAWGQTGPVSTFYLYISLHRPSLPSSTSVSYIHIYIYIYGINSLSHTTPHPFLSSHSFPSKPFKTLHCVAPHLIWVHLLSALLLLGFLLLTHSFVLAQIHSHAALFWDITHPPVWRFDLPGHRQCHWVQLHPSRWRRICHQGRWRCTWSHWWTSRGPAAGGCNDPKPEAQERRKKYSVCRQRQSKDHF